MTLFRILSGYLLAAAIAGCTLVGPRSFSDPGPSPAGPQESLPPSVPAPAEPNPLPSPAKDGSPVAVAVVKTALDAIGTPYEWGGTDENGFDCSGLIQYSYARYGIALPRVSRDQLRLGTSVPLDAEALRPGDVLGFSQEVGGTVGGTASHVGLYLGEGRFLHSSSSGVRLSDIRESYWQRHLVAARRMVRGP